MCLVQWAVERRAVTWPVLSGAFGRKRKMVVRATTDWTSTITLEEVLLSAIFDKLRLSEFKESPPGNSAQMGVIFRLT